MQIVVSNTNLGVMFKASDNIINKYGANAKHEVPESIKGQSTLSVLKRLFGQRYFSISEFDKLVELHKVEISREHYDWMNSLHCVDFSDMHNDTREYLFAICIQYFKPVLSMAYANNC